MIDLRLRLRFAIAPLTHGYQFGDALRFGEKRPNLKACELHPLEELQRVCVKNSLRRTTTQCMHYSKRHGPRTASLEEAAD
jgi:hypothetical protein